MNFEIVDPSDIDPSGDDDQLDTLDDIPAPNESGNFSNLKKNLIFERK